MSNATFHGKTRVGDSHVRSGTLFVLLSLGLFGPGVYAGYWKGLDAKNHICGPKLTEKQLQGKVVLVDMWGIWCKPCKAMMPHTQEIRNKYRARSLVVVASHPKDGWGYDESLVKEFVRNGKYDFSFYLGFEWSEDFGYDRGLPYLYVIDAEGKVAYGGRDVSAVEDAIARAIDENVLDPELIGDESWLVAYKSLRGKLVLGKSVVPVMAQLKKDVKTADSNPSSSTFAARKREAIEIATRVKARKVKLVESIERAIAAGDKADAVRKINLLMATWPNSSKEWAPRKKQLES